MIGDASSGPMKLKLTFSDLMEDIIVGENQVNQLSLIILNQLLSMVAGRFFCGVV